MTSAPSLRQGGHCRHRRRAIVAVGAGEHVVAASPFSVTLSPRLVAVTVTTSLPAPPLTATLACRRPAPSGHRGRAVPVPHAVEAAGRLTMDEQATGHGHRDVVVRAVEVERRGPPMNEAELTAACAGRRRGEARGHRRCERGHCHCASMSAPLDRVMVFMSVAFDRSTSRTRGAPRTVGWLSCRQLKKFRGEGFLRSVRPVLRRAIPGVRLAPGPHTPVR